MDWKPRDWIEHPTYGIGQVSENRGDKLDIDFVGTGRKTLLKSTELKPATPPSPDFKFPSAKGKSRTPRFKVQHPPKQPPLDFNYLVEGFVRFFDGGGFDSIDFDEKERKEKRKAAGILKDKLGKEIFENLLRDGRYVEVCDIAKSILRSTNLAHRMEQIKFADGLKIETNQEPFANALYDLLHGSGKMEQRFTNFCDLLSKMGANKWPVATYYQFLMTDGQCMFMKPRVMQEMAESLKMSLEYKPEPNWGTFSKLQEFADRVEQELADCVVKLKLQNRGLKPRSRIDVQGFIWASIKIADGTYGEKGS
jgi:hypothetical protein